MGAYSRVFRRGGLAALNGRTWEGRFVRTVERALYEHLGGEDRATVPQKLLVGRLARVALRIELLDLKIGEGEATDHDVRLLGGLSNQYRLLLRDIGIKSVAATQRPQTALDYLRAKEVAAS
jgi:hypothetical protein